MSRQEIVKILKSKNPALSHSELEKIIDIFCKSIVNALNNEKNVELRGFGSFFIKKTKEKYSARNPRTGEIIYIPQKNRVRFRPSKKLKELINK